MVGTLVRQIGAEMQLRNRNLSGQAFPAPRIYKKLESNAYAEALRFSQSNNGVDGRALDPIGDSDLFATGYDHPELVRSVPGHVVAAV